jgi:PAS domain S-box-containing protein
LAEVFKIINMYSRQVVDNPVEEVIRRGVIVGLANHTVVIGRNGAEACIEDSAAPIRDENGVMLGVVLVFRDVTDSYRVKRELEESENRFRRLADAAPVLIWTSAPDKSLDWLNAQWVAFTGISFEEGSGEGWLRAVHPDDRQRAHETYVTAFNAREPFRTEYRLRRHDGVYRWVLDSGSPRRGPQGEFMGYVGSCIDIDEQKRAIEGRDQFLSVASHELRTPLTSLKLETQMRKRGLVQGKNYSHEQWNSLLDGYDRQILRLTRLIDDMLDISRIHSGKLSLQPSRFELSEMVEDVVERTRPQFDAAGIKVSSELQNSVQGDWDRFRMEQVLTNLLSNGIKYGGGSALRIEVSSADGFGILRVSDSGQGIEPADQKRIFDRFERVGDSDSASGLGLGLFIVREILSLHRGTISVESQVGRGSTFTVTVPLAV